MHLPLADENTIKELIGLPLKDTFEKAAPDMILHILGIIKTLPHETMMIGDTIYDIEMGQKANCITCGVTYGNHTKEQLEQQNADYIINDFKDLLEIAEA